MNRNEHELIRRIRDGNTAEYEVLVRRYQVAVYHVLYQMLRRQSEAEELAQEVFVKAWEKLDSFNYRSKFLCWIYRIAINTAISHQNRERRFLHPDNLPEVVGQEKQNPDAQLMDKERDASLHQAIAQLKEKYQTVILLHYFEQLSYAEIAREMELTEKKVKSRLFDARRMLREQLSEHI